MLKNYIKLAGIFIGTVIGAGFASGQEIIQFFGIFGKDGVKGLILTSSLFFVITYVIMELVLSFKVNTYNQLVTTVLGRKMGAVVDKIITILMFFGYAIMVSGSGALLNQNFNFPYWLGIAIMIITTYTVFLFKARGIADVNTILVPIIIILTIVIAANVLVSKKVGIQEVMYNTKPITINWVMSSLIYVSYNCIPILVILSSVSQYIDKKSTALKASLLGNVILFVLAFSILYSCMAYLREAQFYQVPMLYVSSIVGARAKNIYCLVLWLAMFTTAISSGFGLINRISLKKSNRYNLNALMVCLISIPISFLGFKDLISALYPTFGYIGLAIILCCGVKMIILKIQKNMY